MFDLFPVQQTSKMGNGKRQTMQCNVPHFSLCYFSPGDARLEATVAADDFECQRKVDMNGIE